MNKTQISNRRTEALRAFKKLVSEVSAQLHPEDVEFEPRNFAAWMERCDGCDRGGLASMINYVSQALDSARLSAQSGNAHSALYVRMRTPFARYAQSAATRRFGAVCLLDLDEHSEF